MSGTTTRTMLTMYTALSAAMRFFSGFFQSPASNFYNTEEVEIDITRDEEAIAIVVTDLSTGYRMNSADLYTNKSFKPPVLKEAVPLNSHDLLKRMAGDNPFADKNFRADVLIRIMESMAKLEKKIRRTIELQAAQILQTGTVTLNDAGGNALYTISFQPKTTHFPTVSVAWGAASDNILGDLESLIDVNRDDGLEEQDQLILGKNSFGHFIKDETVLARLDNRNFNVGQINVPEMRGQGGKYHGTVTIGQYPMQVWTYNGKYKDPQTGALTPYLNPDKVIVRSSTGRMDATFGAVPNIGELLGVQGRLIPELPGRFANAMGGMDLFTRAWITPDGDQLFGGIASRPLMIPTAIDTFGCLTTTV